MVSIWEAIKEDGHGTVERQVLNGADSEEISLEHGTPLMTAAYYG